MSKEIRVSDPNKPDTSKKMLGVLGDSGVGKTYFLGSAVQVPNLCPFCIINCDDSAETLRTPKFVKTMGVDFLPFRVFSVDTIPDINRIIDEIKRESDVGTFNGVPFKLICVDNVSEQHRRDLEIIRRTTSATQAERPLGQEVPGRRDYLRVQHPLLEMLARLRYELSQHVVVTFAAKHSFLPDQTPVTRMSLPPGVGEVTARFFSILALLESTPGGQRRLIVKNTAQWPEVKDRTQLLPDFLNNASMATIYRVLRPVWNPTEEPEPTPTERVLENA